MFQDEGSFRQTVLEWYESKFPTTLRDRRLVGQEKEYPLICQDNLLAADGRLLFPAFIALGWQPKYDDVNKEVMLSVVSDEGIELTTEAGWCTLELIMPPQDSVIESFDRLAETEELIAQVARENGMLLLGYGIQPITSHGRELWIDKRRHQVIRQALPESVNVVTITASDQVHVDIRRSELVDSVNVFNALSGVIIQLFANSPVWQGQLDEHNRLAVREDMWRFTTPDRMGMFPRYFQSLEDFFQHMLSLEQLIVRSNGDYAVPRQTFWQYVQSHPQTDWQLQWLYLEGMTWTNARPRVPYATIEVRPACCQSAVGSAALAALSLGVMENLDPVLQLVQRYDWEFWQDLRQAAIYGQKAEVLWPVAAIVLQFADQGLRSRNLGEEMYLDQLWKAVTDRSNKAMAAKRIFASRGLEALIDYIVL